MDFPDRFKDTFKDILPENLTTDKAIELLLAAIAYEQFALGNILDAEASKINHAVSLSESGLATLDEVREINNSAFKVLKAVIQKEMLLEFELDDLIDFIPKTSTSSTTATATRTTTTTTSTTTSQTYTSCTTTKDSRNKWVTLWKFLLFLIYLSSNSDSDHNSCSYENYKEEDYCQSSDCCKNGFCHPKSYD